MENDIRKIEQVLYRACHAVDRGNADEFLQLFHPQGTLHITWEENGKHTGHAEIRAWFENYDKTLRSAMKYLRHKITCPVIDVRDNSATVYAYLDVEAAPKNGKQVTVTVGHYEDQLVKVEDRWRLKEKKVFMENVYAI